MFSRNVITRRGRGFRGKFPSRKLGRMVAGESITELDGILLLEFSPGVASYREQPALIRYCDGESVREYYPDFEVVLISGEVIHLEIKTAKELTKPIVQAKYRAIAADYTRRQHGFRILTDEEIRQGTLYENLSLLRSFLHVKPAEMSKLEWLARFGRDLVQFSVVADVLGHAEVLRLIAWGLAHGDLRLLLAADAKVQLIDQGGCDATYLL
ncbi:TnsA endonuclease N-terminal domain-containing protein [uncultured Azonexus sp.]|uniref:TnsA endonuclease N-terminal domain-containing protein n=1 Tax=uncultured Azonexus sp. TaxID=520307 RepID=UPI002628111D|nr:TnsA endonuclease N-terminal domain-containing protein [uncultured Azonexus sp.]